MPYYRHWIEHNGHTGPSTMGFLFTELDADDLVKKLDADRANYCKGFTSLEREMRYHTPLFSHVISKEDYDARKKFSDPIKQIIYQPCHCKQNATN